MIDVAEAPPPTRAERIALILLQIGVVAVAMVASAHNSVDLDRFFVPKELVLNACAAMAGLLALGSLRRDPRHRIDRLLLFYLLLTLVSALLATNRWLGLRALAVTASALLLFRIARTLSRAGLRRQILIAVALAAVAAAVSSLLQAYGLRLDVFSLNRAPGGTLGNRNFVAHAAAFGVPICLWVALQARSKRNAWLASSGVALLGAALVLTRSRAAWLAAAAMLLVLISGFVAARPLRSNKAMWRIFFKAGFLTLIAVGAALILPNALHWKSDNPYLESMKSVANYQGGSGHGRLIQYERTLWLALRHPFLGVGPGNWPVEYPKRVPADDPSLDPSNGGMTFNPWPSSDWMASIAERGITATALLVLALIAMAVDAVRRLLETTDTDDALGAVTLLATLTAVTVAGIFDAVLLLALPSMLVWVAAGALLRPASIATPTFGRGNTTFAVIAIVIAAAGAARSGAQLAAMEIMATRGDRASLERASKIDPGNYRLQLRLARGGKRRCEHALLAHALFPAAGAAREASRRCQ